MASGMAFALHLPPSARLKIMSASETAFPEESANVSFELEQSDLYSNFMLYSRTEILFILRSMAKKNCLTSVYFDQGHNFFLSSIIEVDERSGRFILDRGSDEALNLRALQVPRLLCTANLDKVKIQFRLDGLQSVQHSGKPAFAATVPESLLRLQRREYFRLETPQANPILCQIRSKSENGVPIAFNLPLVDISGGGVGLTVPLNAEKNFSIGTAFAGARIDLPEEGLIQVDLAVRSLSRVTLRNGNQNFRAGCEFINLAGSRLTMIQRYITRIERERKARLSGFE